MSVVLAHQVLVALPFAAPAVLVTAGIGVMAFLQRNAPSEDLEDVSPL